MVDYLPLAKHKNDAEDYRRAKELRKNASLAERLLWGELRKLSGLKFRRQHPIHPYIADFARLKLKLIIEIDGDSHNSRGAHDAERDRFLKQSGYVLLRFTNEDVYRNREGVVMQVLSSAKQLAETTVIPLP